MSPLSEFLHGFTQGVALGIPSASGLGWVVGVACCLGVMACGLAGCLWMLWQGGCRVVGMFKGKKA